MIVRAKPLLGTLVTIQAEASAHDPGSIAAIEAAFEIMAHVGTVMSAHNSDSDLGRMSRAVVGQVLALDVHTICVLKASQYWSKLSAGAFNPVKAAQILVRKGLRPGLLSGGALAPALAGLEILSTTQVRMSGPVLIDLGGIAKGYAVDRAIEVLAQHGVSHAIVNAGGDLRVFGEKTVGVEVRHAAHQLRDRVFLRVRRLQQGALATSVAEHADTEFVQTVPSRRHAWRNATVMARDCMTADVLTKWALQSSILCPQLRAAMRENHARMWRN